MLERVLTIGPGGSRLGLLRSPEKPPATAVLIVVGGRQYRIGSHRQFVLLARALAAAGYAALCMDVQGMGDSDGEELDFTGIEDEVGLGVAALREQFPEVQRVVLWGLCDGATAALAYASNRSGVDGLVLLNPWVATVAGRHEVVNEYYWLRWREAAFWRRMLKGKVRIGRALAGLARTQLARLGRTPEQTENLPGQFARQLRDLRLPLLLVTSGRDFTAREFLLSETVQREVDAQLTAARLQQCHLEDADHTFTDPAHVAAVEQATLAFLAGFRE